MKGTHAPHRDVDNQQRRATKKNLIYYNLKGTNWAHPTHLRRAVVVIIWILHTENDTLFHSRLNFPLHTYASFFPRWGIDSRKKKFAPVFNSLFIIYYFILSIFKWVAHFASEAAVRGWILRFRFMCISSGWRRRHAQTSAAVSDKHITKYVRHNFIRILLFTFCLFGGTSQSVLTLQAEWENKRICDENEEMNCYEMIELKHPKGKGQCWNVYNKSASFS